MGRCAADILPQVLSFFHSTFNTSCNTSLVCYKNSQQSTLNISPKLRENGGISLYHTLLRMRSQIRESIEELHRKIDVATHSKQSVIKGYYMYITYESY